MIEGIDKFTCGQCYICQLKAENKKLRDEADGWIVNAELAAQELQVEVTKLKTVIKILYDNKDAPEATLRKLVETAYAPKPG